MTSMTSESCSLEHCRIFGFRKTVQPSVEGFVSTRNSMALVLRLINMYQDPANQVGWLKHASV